MCRRSAQILRLRLPALVRIERTGHMKISISATMENSEAAQSLFNHLVANGFDNDGLGIADGATVVASVDAGVEVLAAQAFYEFLAYR